MKHDSTITILNQKRIIPDCQNGVIIASQKTMHVPIIHTNKYQEKSRQKCYLSPHGGIGDQIICNGLVRFLHKTKFREIHLEINKNNEKNVKRMYKDCKWIRFFYSDLIGDSNEFRTNNSDILFLKIRCDRSIPRALERFFYKCVDVPFEERWNSWFVERNEIDRAREKKIMNYLGLKENYIFISDKWSGGVTNLRISNNLQQIKPYNMKYEETIFDWIGVLEKAKEIHCANTSFFHLINSLDGLNGELFYHNCIGERSFLTPSFNKNGKWNIVQYGHCKKKKKKKGRGKKKTKVIRKVVKKRK